MSWQDFSATLNEVEGLMKKAAGSILSQFDRMTFGMLVNSLKSPDAQAVKAALDQLAKEKRGVGIPPVYLVSVAHPNPWVKQQAARALSQMAPPGEIEKLTGGKEIKEATQALIEHYGHFRA